MECLKQAGRVPGVHGDREVVTVAPAPSMLGVAVSGVSEAGCTVLSHSKAVTGEQA